MQHIIRPEDSKLWF